MFLDYYNLREQPFGVTPDPRYLYSSPTHREALASLFYGVMTGRGFMALIAQPGMGKTTLLFQLLQRLEASSRTVFLFQTLCTPRDFLRSLLADLGAEDQNGDLVRMHSKLNEILLQSSRSSKRFVVLIDEAQNLESPVLEVVRMLSNFETPSDKLMQIVLAGQPQLGRKLASPLLVQLRQRISILGRLMPFTRDETDAYIDHRLRVAGYDFATPLFTDRARAMIAAQSDGIPRNINNICFNALSLGCAIRQRTIDLDVIREVLNDLSVEPVQATPVPSAEPETRLAREVSLPAPRVREKSLLGSWLPRLATAGMLLLTLAGSLADPNKMTTRASASQIRVSAEEDPAELLSPIPLVSAEAPYRKLVSTPPSTDIRLTGASEEALPNARPAPDEKSAREVPGAISIAWEESLLQSFMENFDEYKDQMLARILEPNPWRKNQDTIRFGHVGLPSARDISKQESRAAAGADGGPGKDKP